jgi:2-iminoacetate synthase
MTTSVQSRLESLVDWIQKTDPHASHRLQLLQQLRQLPSERAAGSGEPWGTLAARLERWRYQLLNEHARSWTPQDEALAAALDLAAHELTGRGPRPPRSAHRAIHDHQLDAGRIAKGMACLDRSFPLDAVTRQAAELTREHFGSGGVQKDATARWPMLLYAPIYLSNHCINHCIYCGFRHPNTIGRKHLAPEEALREAMILRERGFRHVLLVAGDFPSLTSTAYFADVLRTLAEEGFELSIEIAPQSTASYAELHRAGTCGVTLYQETYNEDLYAVYHPRGSKTSFDWRLEGLDRAAEAGIERLGLGILLGLADPRDDLLALMRHGRYLESRFPGHTLAFSLPRIHEAPDGFRASWPIDDETFVRMYCALRTAFPKAVLVLSTREAPELRNRLAGICITQLSAGSSTAPGGYQAAAQQKAGQQFPVHDPRTVAEVVQWLREAGFRIVWSGEE